MTQREIADLWAHAQKQWPNSPTLQAQLVRSIKALKSSPNGWALEARNQAQHKNKCQ